MKSFCISVCSIAIAHQKEIIFHKNCGFQRWELCRKSGRNFMAFLFRLELLDFAILALSWRIIIIAI